MQQNLRFGLVGAGWEVQSSFSNYFEKPAQMHMLCIALIEMLTAGLVSNDFGG